MFSYNILFPKNKTLRDDFIRQQTKMDEYADQAVYGINTVVSELRKQYRSINRDTIKKISLTKDRDVSEKFDFVMLKRGQLIKLLQEKNIKGIDIESCDMKICQKYQAFDLKYSNRWNMVSNTVLVADTTIVAAGARYLINHLQSNSSPVQPRYLAIGAAVFCAIDFVISGVFGAVEKIELEDNTAKLKKINPDIRVKCNTIRDYMILEAAKIKIKKDDDLASALDNKGT
ncbi:uncharacterized protein LOC134685256 [Mytilus trossulus]|uniref:uncharacterized protein LOC134685256 n=1 Tax=Mytilus trossulus TaxID=6551 RepID=UPI003005286F